MALSLILADSQPIVLAGLRSVLRREKNFKIRAECTSTQQTLRALRKHQSDILVVDPRISSNGELAVLRQISKAIVTTRSVIFTAALTKHQVAELVRLGASGLVLKTARPEVLVRCIRKVAGGGKWFLRDSSRAEIQLRKQLSARPDHESLSPRQTEIVQLVARGLRNREISKKLAIREGTVQVHLHDIYKKLNLPHRLALALYARDTAIM
jgi:DNA-binding NarL/FixJ family response regulator